MVVCHCLLSLIAKSDYKTERYVPEIWFIALFIIIVSCFFRFLKMIFSNSHGKLVSL